MNEFYCDDPVIAVWECSVKNGEYEIIIEEWEPGDKLIFSQYWLESTLRNCILPKAINYEYCNVTSVRGLTQFTQFLVYRILRKRVG